MEICPVAHGDVNARAREERYRVIRAELLARLRPVCENMPNDLFLEMVENMTAIRLKYEMGDAHGSR
jgi:hypothetical protein